MVIPFKLQPTESNYDLDNDDDEWTGLSTQENERDEEYEDEELLATVTVVEDFDPDTILHGPPNPDRSDHPPIAHPDRKEPKQNPSRQLKSNTGSSMKSKRKKIPYETADARKMERTKQRARRLEKAELAGGKAARKSKSARGVRRKASFKR